MEKAIQVSNHTYPVEWPDKCPICHYHGEIQVIKPFSRHDGGPVQIVFQCAFTGCKSFFIGYYGPRPEKQLKALKPQKPQMGHMPAVVRELSPSFVEIFREAEEAHHLRMTQIAGPGYRKAFEFLIKDYAKSLKPDAAEDIERSFSGQIVNDYIPDTRIQAVAKRALWLGNDETHYLKKWVEHDINDFITLIKLTTNWIEIERLSESYQQEMPE